MDTASEREIYARLSEMGQSLVRIETRLEVLPCVERGLVVNAIGDRVKILEDSASYTRGAIGAAKYIWGAIILGVVNIAGLVVVILRVSR